MARKITNKTGTTVLLRLRSGVTLPLRAYETSADLEDADVLDNPRIGRQVERGTVAFVEVEPEPARRSSRRPRRAAEPPAGTEEKGDEPAS